MDGFKPRLPRGAICVRAEMRHIRGMRLHPLQQRLFDADPSMMRQFESQLASGPAYAALYDGIVWAAWGLVVYCKGNAEAWMLRDRHVGTHGVSVARIARQYFDEVGTAMALHRCQVSVQVSFSSAVRFAEWLKFEEEGVMRRYGPTGDDYYLMARLYDDGCSPKETETAAAGSGNRREPEAARGDRRQARAAR